MEYREIGKTGCKSSIIGLGCEHLDGRTYETISETVSAAMEQGVNLLDVFMPGREVRENIARASSSRAEMLDALRYLDTSDAERDYSHIYGTLRNDFRGNCVYCSHCRPCPAEIDIAAVNKYLDIARLDEGQIPPSIRSHYASLAHGGNECIGCGSCEKRCPFGVPIIDRMSQAARLFAE